MLSLKRILLPVDFSPRSIAAAHYAKALACPFQAEVILFHAVPPIEYTYGFEFGGEPMEVFSRRPEEARKQLETFAPEPWGTLTVKRIVVEGDPATEIVECAKKEDVDLIVMPTHGYGPFRRFILGSVTTKVLHDTDCPVFTGAHLEETAVAPFAVRKVTCAVDLSDHSKKVAQWAADFAERFEAPLAIVHATPLTDPALGELSPEWRVMVETQAREAVVAFLEELQLKADVIVEHGEVAAVVSDIAKETNADLLVIGRSSESGILGRLKAKAYGIIQRSPVPVVSV